MRHIQSIAMLLAFGVSNASAAIFWVSSSNTSSAPPANASQIPVLPPSGTVYVWRRPDSEETLLNWNLTMHTSNPGVINFTAIEAFNPLLGMVTFPPPPKPILRYEYPVNSYIQGDGQTIGMKAYTVANMNALGVGIGPDSAALDPLYDAANDSWLLSEMTYAAVGNGMTDLFLQIGQSGLNHLGQSSSQSNVIFGALTDPALNGVSGRQQDSATPEAHIVVPEPSTVLIGTFGLLGLVCYGFRNRQRDLCSG